MHHTHAYANTRTYSSTYAYAHMYTRTNMHTHIRTVYLCAQVFGSTKI